MDRRDVLKMSPLVLGAGVGRVAFAQTDTAAGVMAAGMFNVRSFGATGDGKTVDTPAVNRAIDAVASAGGGTLVFPGGNYLCFTIRLKSMVTLHLTAGATIIAADSPMPGERTGYNGGSYDAAGPPQPWEAYQDYGHNHWGNSLIYGESLHDVAITGEGMIWGRGLSFGYGAGTFAKDPKHGVGGKFVAEQAGVGNKAIALKNCRNVLLRDVKILKGGHFALLATGVDNLTLDNLLVDTDRDGFDIDCCRNVRVSNCTVNSPWDDAICPKSSYALGYARSTDNVTIANCYVTGAYQPGTVMDGTWKRFAGGANVWNNGRIKCGTESNGGFRNIAITNCVLEGSKGIALESSDGALIEDVAISNITMRETGDVPLFLRLNRRNRGPKESMRPGVLRRVAITNVVSHDAAGLAGNLFVGVPGMAIEDVRVSDSYFGHRAPGGDVERVVPELEEKYPEPDPFGATPSHGFFVRHVKRLEMSHVEVAPAQAEARPAFWLEDVERADFFAVTAPAGKNFALRDVRDLRVLWSRAAKDVTLAQVDSDLL